MIVTVTPNLALDVTYQLPELRPGEAHRVENVHARAGGKGVNVARVLHALGHDVLVIGLAGGATGAALRADLDAAGMAHDLVPIAGETRRTVTVVAGGDATLLNEPGPTITPEEWAALEARIPDADVVVISGSLPPGVPADAVARLARRHAPVIVDTSGEPLRHAAPYAWAVKPNAGELTELTGTDDPVAGARALLAGTDHPVTGDRSPGAPAVVVSLGAEGLLAVVGDDVHRVAPPQVVTGNPTGAGDSVVAALAAGIGSPWPDLLKDAAALSAAAVLAPVAGAYDPAAYEGFRQMPLVSAGEIVVAGHGVGAFNVIQLEHAEALIDGAEAAGGPVILQISENCVRYHGALEPIALATLAAARQAKVPVAVHLDHATSPELVREAVELGLGSVMYDASALDYDANVATTAEMTAYCHDRDVWVEAELGEVGGKDGVHAPGARTDPEEAARFVAATGVDALAVAVGTSHAMTDRTASVDLDLIAWLSAAVPVPLVLHGSSGVPDADLTRAVQAGIVKVNIATHLNKVFTDALRGYLADHPTVVDTRKYVAPGRDAVAREVARLIGTVLTRG